MKKVLSRLAKVGRSSSHAAAEPTTEKTATPRQENAAAAETTALAERPVAYDLVGRERSLSGLQRAVWDGDVDRVRAVTAKSTAGLQSRDRAGRSLLHLAAARGHRQMAELLLERRLPLDAPDADGNTPLLKAVEADSAPTVRLLLEHGANASHANLRQQNGLHISARRGSETVLQALLQHGANVDQVDTDGHTPLHVAVLNSHGEQAAALLLHGAALAPADADGRTALHLAAAGGLTELVARLLENGAEPELKDSEGLTAGELATREGFPHVQSQIRRLSRRHRSLSQMFSTEDLQLDGPTVETAKVHRIGSTSSAGIPTPRLASSLSSAGVPTPRLASSLSSNRGSVRLASSMSSVGDPESVQSRPDSVAGAVAVTAASAADSDSWSDDDELNFAPPPRKVSIPLPACFQADTSPLPVSRRSLDHSEDNTVPDQPRYSDISGLKRLSSASSDGGGGGIEGAGDSPRKDISRRRTSRDAAPDSVADSPREPRSGSDRRHSRPGSEAASAAENSWSERDAPSATGPPSARSPVRRTAAGQADGEDSWGDVSPIPFASAGEQKSEKRGAAETGAGDAPSAVREAARPTTALPAGGEAETGGDVFDTGEDSWGDDSLVSPVLARPPPSQSPRHPPTMQKEPEVERADSVSEGDSWGDSAGSPVLPGSPREQPVPPRRLSGGLGTTTTTTGGDGGGGGGAGSVDAGLEPAVREDAAALERNACGPPASHRSGEGVPEIQHPGRTAEEGEGEENEDEDSSWGDVSPVLPRSPAVPRRESLMGGGAGDHPAPAPAEEEPVRPGARVAAPPSPDAARPNDAKPVAQDDGDGGDSWGDVSPVLPRSPPGAVVPAVRSVPEPETEEAGGSIQTPAAAEPPPAEDSWGDVSPILTPRQRALTAAPTGLPVAHGVQSGNSPPAPPATDPAAAVGVASGVSDGGGRETGLRSASPEQPSDDSWGDDSLPSMGHSDGEVSPIKRHQIQEPQDVIDTKEKKDEPASGNISAIAKVSEDSWSDHSSVMGDKSTCKQDAGRDFERRRSSVLNRESAVDIFGSGADSVHSSFASEGQKSMPVESDVQSGDRGAELTELGKSTSGAFNIPSQALDPGDERVFSPPSAAASPPQRLSGHQSGPALPQSPPTGPAGGVAHDEDSGSWDDVSSAADDGGDSTRLAQPPTSQKPTQLPPSQLPPLLVAGRRQSSPSEPAATTVQRSRIQGSLSPVSPTSDITELPPPADAATDAAATDMADNDSWDSSSAAEPSNDFHPGHSASTATAAEDVTGPVPPARRRSVTLVSPPRSRDTSEAAEVSQTQTQCSTSLAGTLGRDGTLQGTDELWEGNATLRADDTAGDATLRPEDTAAGDATLRADTTVEGVSPRDPLPLAAPLSPPPLELPSSGGRSPRPGARRMSVNLPLSADAGSERRRRGSVASVSSVSSTGSLSAVGRTLRDWRHTLLAPLRARRRRRSVELPARRHSICIDSFLSERAALTADDEPEDMYREEAMAPRSTNRAVSHSPEPVATPMRPPRGRRSKSADTPPPVAPRRHRLSGGSLADIVEADAEEEAEDRRRRRGRTRTSGSGGGGRGGRPKLGRRLSLDVAALGLTRSRHRGVVSPTDQRGSDRDSGEDSDFAHQLDDDIFTPTSKESTQRSSRHDLDAAGQLRDMVKELQEVLAAEKELRDRHQRRAESLQEDLYAARTARESLQSQLSETATAAETLRRTVDEQQKQLAALQESSAAAGREHGEAAERSRLELQQLTREAEARIAQVRAEVDERLDEARRETAEEWRGTMEKRLAEAAEEAERTAAAARDEAEKQWSEKLAAADGDREGREADIEAARVVAREEAEQEWERKMEQRVAEVTEVLEKKAAEDRQLLVDDWGRKLETQVEEARKKGDVMVVEVRKNVEEEWQKKLDSAVAEVKADQEEKLVAVRTELENENTSQMEAQLAEFRAADEAKLTAAQSALEAEWQRKTEAQIADALAEAEANAAAERAELESTLRQSTERQLTEARSEAEAEMTALKQQIAELQQRAAGTASDFDARLVTVREEVESQCRQQWEARLVEADERTAKAYRELEEERQNNNQRLAAEVERRVTEVRSEMEQEKEKILSVKESETEQKIKSLQDEIEELQKKQECHTAETQTEPAEPAESPELAASTTSPSPEELKSAMRAEVLAELESDHARQLAEAHRVAEAERESLRTQLEAEHTRRAESRIAEVRAEVDSRISATLRKAEATLGRLKDNLEAEHARQVASETARLGAEADARVAALETRLTEEHEKRLGEERERWQAEARKAEQARAQGEADIKREAAERLAEAERLAAENLARLQEQLDALEKGKGDASTSKLAVTNEEQEPASRPVTPYATVSDLDARMQEELTRIASEYEHQVAEIRADLLKVKVTFEEEKRAADDEQRRQEERDQQHRQQQLDSLNAELTAASAARAAAEAELSELRAQTAAARRHALERPSQPYAAPADINCERCREDDIRQHNHCTINREPPCAPPPSHGESCPALAESCPADGRRPDVPCSSCSATKLCQQPPLEMSRHSLAARESRTAVTGRETDRVQSVTSVGVQAQAQEGDVESSRRKSSRSGHDDTNERRRERRAASRRRRHSGGGSLSDDDSEMIQRRGGGTVGRETEGRRRRGRRWTDGERRNADSSDAHLDEEPPRLTSAAAAEAAERAEVAQLRAQLGESRAHVAELRSSLGETARQAAERQHEMEAQVGHLTRQLAKIQLSRQLAALGALDSGSGPARGAGSTHSRVAATLEAQLTVTEEEEPSEAVMVTSTPRRVQSDAVLTRRHVAALQDSIARAAPTPAARLSQSEEVKVRKSSSDRRRGGGGGGPRRAHCSRQVFPDWRLAEASDVDPPPTDRSEPTSCSEPPPERRSQARARRSQPPDLERSGASGGVPRRPAHEHRRSARLAAPVEEAPRAPYVEPRAPIAVVPTPRSPGLESALLAQLRRLQETVTQEQERRGLLELELERLSAGSDATSYRVSRQMERLLAELRRLPPPGQQVSHTDLRRIVESELEGEARRREHLAEDLADTRRVLLEQMVRLGAAVSSRDTREETFVQQCEHVQLQLSAPSSRRSVGTPPPPPAPAVVVSERSDRPPPPPTARLHHSPPASQCAVPLLPELREPVMLPDFRALASSLSLSRPVVRTTTTVSGGGIVSGGGGTERQPSAELARRIRHELDQSVRRHLADDTEWRRWGSGGGSISSVTPRSPSTVHASDEDPVDRSRKDYLATVVNLYSL